MSARRHIFVISLIVTYESCTSTSRKLNRIKKEIMNCEEGKHKKELLDKEGFVDHRVVQDLLIVHECNFYSNCDISSSEIMHNMSVP